jgi:hypothetical protein
MKGLLDVTYSLQQALSLEAHVEENPANFM